MLDVITEVPVPGVGLGGPHDDTEWLTDYGITHANDLLFGGMEPVTALLRNRVPSAMPDLARSLSAHIKARISELLWGLDYLVKNAHGHTGPEDALKHVQFFEALEAKKFPEVIAARGSRRFFQALEEARASFTPKVRMHHIQVWTKRAARMTQERDGLRLVQQWGGIDRKLREIEELVSSAVFELDMAADAMLD